MTWWQTVLDNAGHIAVGLITGAVSGAAMYLSGVGGSGQGFSEQQLLIALAMGAIGTFVRKNGDQTDQINSLQGQINDHNKALTDAKILPPKQ